MKLCQRAIGPDQPLFLIAGPDTLESEALCLEVAGHVAEIARRLGILYVFKGSFDKANRSSHRSYRGPGVEDGLRILEAVQRQIGVTFWSACIAASRSPCALASWIAESRGASASSAAAFRSRSARATTADLAV